MTTDAPDIPVSSRNQNIGTVVITVLPFLGLLAAVTMSWNEAVGLTDLMLFLGLYVICGFGITIGYHRMLTHRAFEAIAPLKAALLVAGSLAIQGAAIRAFEAVDGRGLARVDMFLTAEGELVVNELNTMPGFTPISMFPKCWVASGMTYSDLISDLVDTALTRG